MRAIAIVIGSLALSGCVTGTMFDGYACTFAESEATRQSVEGIMDQIKDGETKQQAEMAIALASLSATAACEARRGIEAKMLEQSQSPSTPQ